MEFLHISDLHFRIRYPRVSEGYASIFRDMASPLELLERGLERIDLSRVSFILVSGDLTEHGCLEDYQQLRKRLGELFGGVPYVVTAGNHDNQRALCQVWQLEQEGQIRLGSVRRFDQVTVIALNNAWEDQEDGRISPEHSRWLSEQLQREKARGQRLLLMMHHPVVKDPESVMPLAACDENFYRILEQYPPEGIFCGHTHNVFRGSLGRIPYFTAGSLSFKGYQREGGNVCFREYASMNLCHMGGEGLLVREIPVEEQGKLLGTVWMGGG